MHGRKQERRGVGRRLGAIRGEDLAKGERENGVVGKG